MTKNYDRRCSCGDIEITFKGEQMNAVFCYCKDCQRVSEISGLCGFDNPESFARAYRKRFGVSATEERLAS